MLKTHICFLDPTSVTNCFPEYEQQTLCGALVVTLATLLRLINCRFIIIIIIKILTTTAYEQHSDHCATDEMPNLLFPIFLIVSIISW